MTSRSQFETWFISKYEENINNSGIKWPPYFKKFLSKIRPQFMSGARRMNAFVATKYNYPLTKAGYLCSVFSCNFKNVDKKDSKEHDEYDTYYSYVYWPKDIKYIESRFGGDARQHEFSTFAVKKKIMPEYMCISPTFDSKDGEFRGDGFILWEEFQHGYEEFSEILSRVEEVIIALIEKQLISLDVTVYPPDKKDDILTQIDEERLIIRIMAVSLLMDGRKYNDNALQVHTNTNYLRLISIIYSNTILKDIVKSIDYFTYIGLTIFHTGKINREYRPRCGQKIFPITIRAAIDFGDPKYKIWKEIDAQIETTDLVINFITPSFSIYNNWTYIDNDRDQGFFECKPMRKKYMDSIRSTLTLDSLKTANKTAIKEEKLSADDEQLKNIYSRWGVKIYKAIEVGESLLLASRLSLCSLSEYVGISFGSIMKSIKGLEIITPDMENLFNDPGIFSKHMFDWMYALYCMHDKLGIMHADLHLNNVTYFRSAPAYKVDKDVDTKKIEIKPKFDNPTIAYIIGDFGAHDCYLLPHYGSYSCIIDFSRCLYGTHSIERFKKQYGPVYARDLFENQIDFMIKLIKMYANENFIKEHGDKFLPYARSNPDNFFKLAASVDFISFSRYLREMLKEEQKRPGTPFREFEIRYCKVSNEVIKIIDNIYLNALALFMKNLNAAFKPQSKSVDSKTKNLDIKTSTPTSFDAQSKDFAPASSNIQSKDEVIYIGAEVIRASFQKYLYTNFTDAQRQKMDLLDAYNFNNTLKYSCRKYETWPDWAQAETIRQNLHGLKLTDILDRGPDVVHRPFQPDPFMEAIIERERLDAEDVPELMKSSVLPE